MDLFNENIDLVKKIVNKMNYGYVAKEDLMQAGLMGLFFASKNYKEDMNVKFNTYATYYIIGEIKKELRLNKLIKLNKKIYKLIKIIKQNTDYTIDDISLKYNIDKQNLLDAYFYMNNISSLDKDIGGEELRLISIIPDKSINYSYLYDALNSLDNEDKKLIEYRYFKNYTQADLVKMFGLNQSRISRIEKNALEKMRKFLLSK